MTIKCPHCKVSLDLTPEFLGQRCQCPSCGKVFTAPSAAPLKAASKVHGGLCWSMGFFFGLLGLLIAHGIDGNDGLGYALRGFFLHIVIVFMLCVVAYTAAATPLPIV